MRNPMLFRAGDPYTYILLNLPGEFEPLMSAQRAKEIIGDLDWSSYDPCGDFTPERLEAIAWLMRERE